MSGSLIWVHGSMLQKAIQQRLGLLGRGRFLENTRFRFLEFSGEFHRNFGRFLGLHEFVSGPSKSGGIAGTA